MHFAQYASTAAEINMYCIMSTIDAFSINMPINMSMWIDTQSRRIMQNDERWSWAMASQLELLEFSILQK